MVLCEVRCLLGLLCAHLLFSCLCFLSRLSSRRFSHRSYWRIIRLDLMLVEGNREQLLLVVSNTSRVYVWPCARVSRFAFAPRAGIAFVVSLLLPLDCRLSRSRLCPFRVTLGSLGLHLPFA